MSTESSKCCKKTSIGGQAVLEGIMMRGPLVSALSVRKSDGTIFTETNPTYKNGTPLVRKIPLVRGVFAFFESLVNGYKYLMRSADLIGLSEEDMESKFEQWLRKKFGDKIMGFVGVAAVILSAILALGLFMVIPMLVVKGLDYLFPLGGFKTLVEGIVKIGMFIAYVAFCAAVPDVRSTFEYHGAEHKCIFCYEAGLPLTVENVRKQVRFHPRCGTSFLLIVFILSILVYSVVTWESFLIRILLKLCLLPLVCGLSYELIKLAGKYTNPFTKILSAPGLLLQRLTTREPNDSQIEVAIAAMTEVIPDDPELDRY